MISKRLALLSTFATIAACLGTSVNARADEEKRPPQDYGAPEDDSGPPAVVVWPARVIFFPLYLLSEFVFRRPIGFIVEHAERDRWIQKFEDLFTFGGRGKSLGQLTLFPTVLLDFGLKPSVGVNGTWKYAPSDANSVRFHFGTWGPDWIALRANDVYEISNKENVFLETSVVRRLDNPFSGIGPFSRQDARTRFALTVAQADVGHERHFWNESVIRTRVGTRSTFFGDGGCCDEPSLGAEVAAGRIVAPGYGNGYRAMFQRIELELDSRRPRPASGSGARIEAHEESVSAFDSEPGQSRRSWVKYGGSVGGALDMTGQQRVVSLSVAADFADPLSGVVPFTDQVSLGGDSLMPGFLRGRLVDRSSAVANLEYTWPIWVYLDGVAHAAVGNVFGEHLQGFDVKSMRLSSGIGFRSNDQRESAFEMLFAVGSEPFDDHFRVDSVRLVIGTHHGF